MAWVIAVLGAALAAGGGVALWNGSGYIRLDWGQAETVAGTVALSAGVVTLAIAAVLFAIRDALRDPARRPAPSRASAGSPAGLAASGVGLEAVHLDDEGTGATDAAGGAAVPAAPPRNRFAGKLARVGMPKPERMEPAAAELPAPDLSPAPVGPDPLGAGSAYDPRPRGAPVAVPEAPRPAVPVMAEAPTVVGRYEANGASYVLFSDGTIEVETDSGTHRFDSMADLKDHIERQGGG